MIKKLKKITTELVSYRRHNLPLGKLRSFIEGKLLEKARIYYSKNKPQLKVISVEAVSDCPNRCWFCVNNKMKRTGHQMSVALYEKIVRQLQEIKYEGLFNFNFRSDPILHDKIVEMVDFASKMLPKCEIQISTSGRTLDFETAEKLVSHPNVYVHVNTYGTKSIINKMSGWSLNDRFVLHFNKDPGNICNLGGLLPTKFKLPLQQFCERPFNELAITAEGLALVCCIDWKDELVAGDLNKQTINEVWNSNLLVELRKKLLLKQRPGLCGVCDNWGLCDYLDKKTDSKK